MLATDLDLGERAVEQAANRSPLRVVWRAASGGGETSVQRGTHGLCAATKLVVRALAHEFSDSVRDGALLRIHLLRRRVLGVEHWAATLPQHPLDR